MLSLAGKNSVGEREDMWERKSRVECYRKVQHNVRINIKLFWLWPGAVRDRERKRIFDVQKGCQLRHTHTRGTPCTTLSPCWPCFATSCLLLPPLSSPFPGLTINISAVHFRLSRAGAKKVCVCVCVCFGLPALTRVHVPTPLLSSQG